MTRGQVEINFEEANRQVRVIEDAVAILHKADQVHSEMQENTASVWKGSNSDNFQSLSRSLGTQMEKQTKLTEELAEWVKHRAKVLYDTEMEAIRIAEERAYQAEQARIAEQARQAEQARAAETARAEEQARAAEQATRNAMSVIRRIFR